MIEKNTALPIIGLLLAATALNAQEAPRSLQAAKVATAPKIDGKLDEDVWQLAAQATSFIISEPEFGKPASRESVVRVLYDQEAIYIGAYLYDEPGLIRQQLTERDNELGQDTDKFAVSFDTYHDRQNAFMFVVTPPNVQSDLRISSGTASSGGDTNFDVNWDAVWDSRTSFAPDGWSVEIRIPYSALRFSASEVQTWGVNFWRYIRRLNEYSYWNPLNPGVAGFVNQYGDLAGLENLSPPLRLSFLPYVSSGFRHVPYESGAENSFLRNGGMDLKYGINESFTLDMTLIPDFGQVRSDDVILNLSPFEQVFAENRPFFTEGTELFNRASLFYSRRIGSRPGGYRAAYELAQDSGFILVKNPTVARLINASKFSGRNQKGLGIGVLNAVTAPSKAVLERPEGSRLEFETEPLANFNILVVDQSLKNRSYLTFTNTNVTRRGEARDANVSALSLSLFNKANSYNFQTQTAFSLVQQAVDKRGINNTLSFNKVGGIWQWGVSNSIVTRDYDPNDLGVFFETNQMVSKAFVSFNQFVPKGRFNSRNYSLNLTLTNRYQPFDFTSTAVEALFFHVFRNFWDLSWLVYSQPMWENDYFEMRQPGTVLRRWPFLFNMVFGSTDSRKPLYFSYELGYGTVLDKLPDVIEDKSYGYMTTTESLRYRFGPKLSAELNGSCEMLRDGVGWVFNDPVSGAPVAGLRRTLEITASAGLIYSFKARMSLNLRARHYWSKVRYRQLFLTSAEGDLLQYPFVEGLDNNFNAFNVDAFYVWDFKPGSRLILAWKNSLGPESFLDGAANSLYWNNFRGIWGLNHSKEATVKFVYFLDAYEAGRR